MLENTLQRKIQKFLKDNLPGAMVWKNHGNQYSVKGLPDLMCIYKGKMICIEVKIEGNEATDLQKATLEKLAKAGAIVGVAYSIDDVKKMLLKNKILEGN